MSKDQFIGCGQLFVQVAQGSNVQILKKNSTSSSPTHDHLVS